MTTIAVVPAKDRADSVGATVTALLGVDGVDRVLVVDDGSTDDTTAVAQAAGADVLRLDRNRGKGGAVAAAVAATPDADVYLLIDADVASTAAVADRLLAPLLADEADLVVGVLPAADGKGGFGTIKRLAASGIRRACGAEVRAPLSGQRAIRAGLLRDLAGAERFGLEVAMTIDAVRAGARLVEVEVPMDHRHTGRSLAGFRHRGRQGLDIVRALLPRLTSSRARVGSAAVVVVVALAGLLLAGGRAVPSSEPLLADGADRVVVIGIPHIALDDLDRLPTIAELTRTGSAAAMSVRTLSTRPSTTEAYASLGAGDRIRTRVGSDQAIPADAELEGSTAAETTARRTGRIPRGAIVVPTIAAIVAGAGEDVNSEPGALGDALRAEDLETAVVSNADEVASDGDNVQHRPAALAVVDQAGSVGTGAVLAEALLVPDPNEPFGIRADTDAVIAATTAALSAADVVVVDAGDTDRALAYAVLSSPDATESARRRALRRADDLVADIIGIVDDRTLVLVVGMTPPTSEWQLTPIIATGAGIEPGTLHSPSTKRAGLVTLTDLAPTILDVLGAPVPDDLIGSPLRHRSAPVDLDALQRADDLAGSREGIYYPMALTFIVVQALLYLVAGVILARGAGEGRWSPHLRFVVLTFAAWPLATFVERAIPRIEDVGAARQALVWVIAGAIAGIAGTARRHALAPLSWVCGITVALLVADVATGARLQLSSVLGYSPHTAARYVGFGNTAFAVLAACTVVAAALHVQFAPRRREALLAVAGVFVIVLVADVWPTLGADVGGVLTMVPVFGLMVLVMSGRRMSWRAIALALVATFAVLVVVTLVDLARPAEDRTHLGRFVADIGDDGSFLTTIERKWSTNIRLLGRTVWTWMVPIAAAFMVYVLVIARGWQRLLPTGSALRAGVLGTLMAGLVGWLVNDSGVVVSALVFVYIGPYLTLLALPGEDEPRLLPADDDLMP